MENKKELRSLPPLVSSISGGDVVWERLANIDFDLMGYFLSCHLVIEHYLDHFLVAYSTQPFSWSDARLTFKQKLLLLSNDSSFAEPWNPVPALKHLNRLRNKLAHNITSSLTEDDLLPIRQYVEKVSKGEISTRITSHNLLEIFTTLVCAYFAGSISRSARGFRYV